MRHEDLIKQMTAKQKVAFLTGKNEWESREYPQFGIPGLFFSDGPSGVRRQEGAGVTWDRTFGSGNLFPVSVHTANSWEEQLGGKSRRGFGQRSRIAKHSRFTCAGTQYKEESVVRKKF